MFANIKIDENELNTKLQRKLFKKLVITGFLANTMGFLSNMLLFGFTVPTIVCGICVLFIMLCGWLGIRFNNHRAASAVMVLMLSLMEFPYLFYVYGANMAVYLVLGIVALAIFFPRPYHVPVIALTILMDSVVIVFSFIYPHTMVESSVESQLGTLISSYLIVALSVAAMLCNFLHEYTQQRTHLMEASKALEYAANHDALTGVYNRRYLMNTLQQWINENDKHFLVALIDVDDYKYINDTYGHVYGDDVLVELSRLMNKEIQDKGIVSRYGGEEFMILFENTDIQAALEILERIKNDIKAYSMRTRQVVITFSGGIAQYRSKIKIDELLSRADQKLYQAKSDGKNCIVS